MIESSFESVWRNSANQSFYKLIKLFQNKSIGSLPRFLVQRFVVRLAANSIESRRDSGRHCSGNVWGHPYSFTVQLASVLGFPLFLGHAFVARGETFLVFELKAFSDNPIPGKRNFLLAYPSPFPFSRLAAYIGAHLSHPSPRAHRCNFLFSPLALLVVIKNYQPCVEPNHPRGR